MTNLMIQPRRIGRELDRFFDDFLTGQGAVYNDTRAFSPNVNIKETKDHVILTFEVPGIDKKDVKVTVKDNLLTVSGSREFKSEETDSDTKWVRTELRSGQFSRSFTLPETVNHEKISADYRHGLLEIKLEKIEQVKPKEIEVKIS